jgi:hypothetical protein
MLLFGCIAGKTELAERTGMAITLQPKFPIPDRSKRTVYFQKDEDGVLDIGWCEGVLSDGRPFRAEMWAQDQISMLTIFFSTVGCENLDNAAIQQLVENERLVSFKDGPRYCASAKFKDDAGNELWSVNIVVGDENNTYLSDSVLIFPYSRCGEPNTMFNPTGIRAAHARS